MAHSNFRSNKVTYSVGAIRLKQERDVKRQCGVWHFWDNSNRNVGDVGDEEGDISWNKGPREV
jgi:hypothetical protein